ncbi:MAG: protein kinase [Gammaproteobacteria bacterium]|nr:protein kinase [Gammaproteobacteria bacterium]
MGILDSFKAKKAVAAILAADSSSSSSAVQASLVIKRIGSSAVGLLLDALHEQKNTDIIASLLEALLSDKTLELYLDELAHDDYAVVPHIIRILGKSGRYDCNLMIDALERIDIRKEHLIDIIKQHAARIKQQRLLETLYSGPSHLRQTVFLILQSIGTDELVPDLVSYAKSDSADTRFRVAKLMASFSHEDIRTSLFELLKDSNKNIRMAALEGLAGMDMPVPVQIICKLLRDSDMMVQSKAIETLIRLNDPTTVKYLIEYLQDEAEYIRRAAVEVLNEVGDVHAIKDLLMALRDKDWWVRVRSADALGTIGGPRVVDAVLALIKDEDPFLRRTAVEILNTSKDERAFDSLVASLKDEDWWVRERAADALASMGNTKAAKPLREMLNKDPQTMQVAIRALANLGAKDSVHDLIEALKNNHPAVQKEAIAALAQLADNENAEDVQHAVTQLISVNDEDVKSLAKSTAQDLADRFSGQTQMISRPEVDRLSKVEPHTPTPLDIANASTTSVHVSNSRGEASSLILIDADRLQPGDFISNRYKVIKRVGKGGFGTVILVEDIVVEDEYILKFLNPAFASDDGVVKRFTHELRYSRKVTHENVIRIYDFLTFGKSYAISMEYFPSHSLADELDQGIPKDMRRMVGIIRDICFGMVKAQQVHVVHRDLKPANLLVDKENNVKIVDFGLAAAASKMDSRITKTGILVGTPTYMAPEQARGEDIDSRTDIYSLGVIMYRIFAGRPPYEEKDPMSTLLKHIEGKAKAPTSLNAEIPPHLEMIIQKAMRVKKEDRYQTFKEFALDLDMLEKEMS